MLPDPILMYFVGVASGSLVAWFVMRLRLQSPVLKRLAVDAATDAVFVKATGQVVDDETGEEIVERANELLDEYDIPGGPVVHFDSD